MNPEEARSFLKENHRSVLATFRRDGSPQMSPVAAGVDPDGLVVVSSRETARKVINLRRDPRAFLCVMSDGFFGRWIQVGGRAAIVALPQAMEGLIAYYRLAVGEHPDWDDYRAAMERERRVLIRFAIERRTRSGRLTFWQSEHVFGRMPRWRSSTQPRPCAGVWPQRRIGRRGRTVRSSASSPTRSRPGGRATASSAAWSSSRCGPSASSTRSRPPPACRSGTPSMPTGAAVTPAPTASPVRRTSISI